jgi:NADH-quinone oxidoreductase subunit A
MQQKREQTGKIEFLRHAGLNCKLARGRFKSCYDWPIQHPRFSILMLENYFPILLFIIVGALTGLGPIILGSGLSRLLGVHRPDSEKLSPYECGFEAFEDARMKFDVRYYLVAILFILFDLEIAFLFPWAIVLGEMTQTVGPFFFLAMVMFLAILVVGFAYEWKKGALEWD